MCLSSEGLSVVSISDFGKIEIQNVNFDDVQCALIVNALTRSLISFFVVRQRSVAQESQVNLRKWTLLSHSILFTILWAENMKEIQSEWNKNDGRMQRIFYSTNSGSQLALEPLPTHGNPIAFRITDRAVKKCTHTQHTLTFRTDHSAAMVCVLHFLRFFHLFECRSETSVMQAKEEEKMCTNEAKGKTERDKPPLNI